MKERERERDGKREKYKGRKQTFTREGRRDVYRRLDASQTRRVTC